MGTFSCISCALRSAFSIGPSELIALSLSLATHFILSPITPLLHLISLLSWAQPVIPSLHVMAFLPLFIQSLFQSLIYFL